MVIDESTRTRKGLFGRKVTVTKTTKETPIKGDVSEKEKTKVRTVSNARTGRTKETKRTTNSLGPSIGYKERTKTITNKMGGGSQKTRVSSKGPGTKGITRDKIKISNPTYSDAPKNRKPESTYTLSRKMKVKQKGKKATRTKFSDSQTRLNANRKRMDEGTYY